VKRPLSQNSVESPLYLTDAPGTLQPSRQHLPPRHQLDRRHTHTITHPHTHTHTHTIRHTDTAPWAGGGPSNSHYLAFVCLPGTQNKTKQKSKRHFLVCRAATAAARHKMVARDRTSGVGRFCVPSKILLLIWSAAVTHAYNTLRRGTLACSTTEFVSSLSSHHECWTLALSILRNHSLPLSLSPSLSVCVPSPSSHSRHQPLPLR